MNWKPLFEELCFRLLGERASWPRLLVGVVLSFIPGLNLFAFGYLYRYTRQIRATGDLELPAWEDWGGLFADGLRFLMAWLLYWLSPVLVAALLSQLLGQAGLDLVGTVFSTVTTLAFTLLFSCALYRMQSKNDFRTLREVRLVFGMALALWKPLVLPLMAFYGFYILVFPLYGLSFFLGFLLILSYTVLCLRTLEQHSRRSL